ncbi:CoA transferase [Pseudonocardia nematodicida]|uniref:CoA transferase n=1 Tax=Pseudonocardia nematodicida TaxID=1206997 RepID=A0ABV1KE19_9PSEU
MDTRPGPLDGVRVLDLTTFLSGPFCTQILADLGAEVIKLEAPDGDSSRQIPPHFVGADSAYFLSHNRSKRSVVVDLKTGAGQQVARDLAGSVDVVVENFRPGVAARLGLDPERMRARHPALVWVSISGFGQTGPWRDRPAYDIVVQALSGVMSLTGVPGADAMRLGVPAGDLVGGMYAVMAALAALVERSRTGEGRWADVAMLDGQLSMLSYQAVYATVAGITPPPQGSRHDSIPTYRSFRAGDGRELVVAANTQRMWAALCAVLGVDDLTRDARFASARARLAHEDELAPLLEEAFLRRPAAEWVDRLVEHSVPAAPIKTVPEALDDARTAGRDMTVLLDDGAGHRVETVGTPLRWMDAAPPAGTYPPALGADTRAVLEEIGYSAEAVDTLQAAGAVDGAAPAPDPAAPAAPAASGTPAPSGAGAD